MVVWYSHLFKIFPQFVVIHTVKGFGVVNKAEVGAFPELSCFFDDPRTGIRNRKTNRTRAAAPEASLRVVLSPVSV